MLFVLACAVLGLAAGAAVPALVEWVAPRAAGPPSRRWLAAIGAVTFAGVGWALGATAALPAFLYLTAVGLALAVVDLDVKRLPDALTLPSYAVGTVLLGLAALVEGAGGAFVRALLGGVALYAFYFVLALIHPAGMGFGDVKLAGVLGLHLGWLGWGLLMAGAFFGFLLGAVSGLALMAARRATVSSAIPFGPFMLAGAWLAVVAGRPLVEAYLRARLG